MDNSSKIIYRTFSLIQSFLFLLFRIGFIAGAAIALYHYSENPVVTVIVALICAVFFFVMGMDEIIVYPDAIKFSDRNWFKFFRRTTYYKIADIESIIVSGDFSTANEMYQRPISGADKPINKIEIKLTNGTLQSFQTTIYIDKLKKVKALVEELKQNRR